MPPLTEPTAARKQKDAVPRTCTPKKLLVYHFRTNRRHFTHTTATQLRGFTNCFPQWFWTAKVRLLYRHYTPHCCLQTDTVKCSNPGTTAFDSFVESIEIVPPSHHNGPPCFFLCCIMYGYDGYLLPSRHLSPGGAAAGEMSGCDVCSCASSVLSVSSGVHAGAVGANSFLISASVWSSAAEQSSPRSTTASAGIEASVTPSLASVDTPSSLVPLLCDANAFVSLPSASGVSSASSPTSGPSSGLSSASFAVYASSIEQAYSGKRYRRATIVELEQVCAYC